MLILCMRYLYNVYMRILHREVYATIERNWVHSSDTHTSVLESQQTQRWLISAKMAACRVVYTAEEARDLLFDDEYMNTLDISESDIEVDLDDSDTVSFKIFVIFQVFFCMHNFFFM